jgi:hypothetical protein
MDRRSFAYGLHCKDLRTLCSCTFSHSLDPERTSAQVMAGLTSEGWPDSISGLILPCGNGADWNCHAQ